MPNALRIFVAVATAAVLVLLVTVPATTGAGVGLAVTGYTTMFAGCGLVFMARRSLG